MKRPSSSRGLTLSLRIPFRAAWGSTEAAWRGTGACSVEEAFSCRGSLECVSGVQKSMLNKEQKRGKCSGKSCWLLTRTEKDLFEMLLNL
ncbi:hypothetical protein CDAR_259271 [Caerostris darwini]|uniref:Secreted protein n=1 Tax=Caerostris darwini TaxID=1538125 RepID=A0AAV4UBN4_9ARAC|nr:hypothetical protein CDAR_259271 [Caerostris darwini]